MAWTFGGKKGPTSILDPINIPTSLPSAADGTYELHPSWGKPVILLNDGPPVRAGGVGGWASSDRVLQPSARWWQTQPGETMTIPGILDLNVPAGAPSIETRLTRLYLMGRTYGKHDQPPTIRLRGDLRPEDRQRQWIMQDIQLADRQMDGPGVILRQHLTVSFEGYYELPSVEGVSIKQTRKPGASQPRTRHVRVKKGDTLRSIAVRELGASGDYKEIQGWNPKLANVDPDQPLQPGLIITLH